MAIATTAADKRRAKARKALAKLNNAEPVLLWESKEDQEKGLGTALSWYSQNTGKKEQKKYVLDYFKSDKSKYKRLKELEDWRFMTIGSLCRMASQEQGYRFEWSDSKFFDNKMEELFAKYEEMAEEIAEKQRLEKLANQEKPKPLTIQQRIFNAASEIGGEFDEQIDIFTTTGKFTSDFEAKKFLAEQGVSATVAGRVAEFFVPVMEELSDAYDKKCDQLVEGYSHLTRTNLRRLRDFVKGLVEDTQQYAQSAKKPVVRKKRTVNPATLVKRVKYQVAEDTLKLRSIHPTKMLDSTEIWIYNTKYKKIQRYVSDGALMSVKGTSIVGFDIKKSQQMTLRKPEEFFKGLSIGKRAMANAWNKLKTKPAAVNGRLNENCIILGAF
jgi:hypothetical protein